MHTNSPAPLEASSEEVSTSAYTRVIVQLQEVAENATAKTSPGFLHFDGSLKCCMHLFIEYKKTPVDLYLYLTYGDETPKSNS